MSALDGAWLSLAYWRQFLPGSPQSLAEVGGGACDTCAQWEQLAWQDTRRRRGQHARSVRAVHPVAVRLRTRRIRAAHRQRAARRPAIAHFDHPDGAHGCARDRGRADPNGQEWLRWRRWRRWRRWKQSPQPNGDAAGRADDTASTDRDATSDRLNRQRVMTRAHYPFLLLELCFRISV